MTPLSTETTLLAVLLENRGLLYRDPRNKIEQLLDTVGDGTGETEMVGNTPKAFFIQPPRGEIYVINRLNVYIEEGMNEKFDAAKYGATTALANGIMVTVENESGNLKTLNPLPITKIGHWNLVAGIDMFFTDFPSGTSDLCSVRWSFFKGSGAAFLIGDNGEKIVMNVPDDLSAAGLVSHIVQVQGFKFRLPPWWGIELPTCI